MPFVNPLLFSNKMSKLWYYVFKQQETADMAFKFVSDNFMTRPDSIYLITYLNVPTIQITFKLMLLYNGRIKTDTVKLLQNYLPNNTNHKAYYAY